MNKWFVLMIELSATLLAVIELEAAKVDINLLDDFNTSIVLCVLLYRL